MTEMKMQLEDWLDDLCVRFIINLPQEDLSSVARICFQVEEAQWFYEDFIRPLDPTLPSMSLRSFCLRIFQHCPLLASFSVENHMRAFEEFLQYKTRVPVRGAILLNEAMDSTVLVKGWKKNASWSFPRGKINKDEDDLDCAIREVYEETGFDIKAAGLVPEQDEVKYIEITMREQQMRLYVFRNIPSGTHFEPKTRKEISKIEWYKLSELPAFRKKGHNHQDDAAAASNANKFYMVAPFLVSLKKWVVQQKKKDALRAPSHMHLAPYAIHEEVFTEDDLGNQTEPATDSIRVTPAIDTLEGATRELQRLLKVQPATQGLQPSPLSGQIQDKGEALLAMLQKNAGNPQPQNTQAQNLPPHTPSDLIYAQAPEPQTPHYHHPTQRLPFSDHQPPPTYVAPLQPNYNMSTAMYNQYGAPRMAPYSNQQVPFSQAAMPRRPHHEAIPLMHPQPLPPQVQKALFDRSMFPSPGVPDGVPGTHQKLNPQYSSVRGPAIQQVIENKPQPPQQMNNHTISLLNAFKGQSSRPGDNLHTGPVAPGPHFPGQAAQAQLQQLPGWLNPGPIPFPQPSGQNMSNMAMPNNQARMNGMPQYAPNITSGKPPAPNDKHRSTLLDLFKQQIPDTQRQEESQRHRGVDESIGSSSASQSRSRPMQLPPLNGTATKPEGQANGSHVQIIPELNLPFGALSILARPKGSEAKPDPVQTGLPSIANHNNPPYSPGTESTATLKPNILSPRDPLQEFSLDPQRNHAAQTLPLQSRPPNASQSQPGYPGYSPASQSSSFAPVPSALQRPKDTNPEQKQKLLSLFSKPQPSPISVASDGKGKEREPPALLDQGSTRSRLASLGSVTGTTNQGAAAGAPQRDTRTPISPADRNFLLGYLESFSSGAPM